MPVYTITHATTYRYAHPVLLSHQAVHLEPLATAAQECLDFSLEAKPGPLETSVRTDYFGNRVHYLTITEPHQQLDITTRSQVAVTPPKPRPAGATCGEARAWLEKSLEPAAHQVRQFLYDSPNVRRVPWARELAAQLFADERPVLEAARELNTLIHREFAFDTAATHPATPLEEFIQIKRGVCQDFAHLAVAVLRAAGLPGRYVSGYLLTNPPPGQPRQVGADASHAWFSAYAPGAGWADYDPTNDTLCNENHITTAHGRDYSDVSPVRGTVVGGGSQALFLGVTVVPAGKPGV